MSKVTQGTVGSVAHPVWKGHHDVQGLWWPLAATESWALLGGQLLAQWRRGSKLLRWRAGVLLTWPEPQRRDCSVCEGWPVVRTGSVLSTAPLRPNEQPLLTEEALCWVSGAHCQVLAFTDAEQLDLSGLLDVEGLTLLTALPAPRHPEQIELLVPTGREDVRGVLSNKIPPQSEDAKAFLRALQSQQTAARTSGNAQAHHPSDAGSVVPGVRLVFLALTALAVIGVAILLWPDAASVSRSDLFAWVAMIGVLIRLWIGGAAESVRDVPRSDQRSPALPERARSRPTSAWRRLAERLTVMTRVSRLLGLRQAMYLENMMRLFESGKMDDALRHAIPLGGENPPAQGAAFGVPQARRDLNLSRQLGPTFGMGVGSQIEDQLRRMYRRSFEQLDRQGKVDEALFVLAELLGARMEALDYLEKHRRFREAADLAIGWDRPSEVIVRFLALAGDWRAAVAVARRDRAFANTVAQLEPNWPEAAAMLRHEWGLALVAQGRTMEAVDAVWPVSSLRPLAMDWLLQAREDTDVWGLRARLKLAQLVPETLRDDVPWLTMLRDDPNAHQERAQLALALLNEPKSPLVRHLTALILPSVWGDHSAGHMSLEQSRLQALVGLADDPLWSHDLPHSQWPALQAQPLLKRSDALAVCWPEPGHMRLFDVVSLGEAGYLVGAGEAGLRWLDRRGGLRHAWAVPAHQLVVSESLTVILALAPRQGLWRVTRIDLLKKATVDLGVSELGWWASSFDGIGWSVARGTTLRVLDTTRSLQDVLWQVTDLPGEVCALSVHSTLEVLALRNRSGELDLWQYVLPQRRLLSRGPVSPKALVPGAWRVLHPKGALMDVRVIVQTESIQMHGEMQGLSRHWQLPPGWASPDIVEVQCHMDCVYVGLQTADGFVGCLLPFAQGDCVLATPDPRPEPWRARWSGDRLVLFDHQGRIWSVALPTQSVSTIRAG